MLNGGVTTDGNDTLVANGHGSEDLWIQGAVYFSSRSKFIPDGGRVSAGSGKVTVSDADSLLILTSVRTNFVDYKTCNGDEKGDAAADIERASKLSYETLYENHKADYQELFKRVDVDLGGDTDAVRRMTTPQRIAGFNRSDDPKMVKTLFQYGRYLMISASRDAQPMNLQGIWNKYSSPAWGSKATTNINYEMNYWPAFTTNLAECFAPFAEKAKGLAETGHETAVVNYGIDKGWVLHHNTDLWNRTGAIDGAWVSNMLYDAYRFTQDEEYLADIYPVIKGSAEFLSELMTTARINGQEYAVISPSTSPEINLPAHPDACIDHSITMDNGIARELFKDVAEASEIGIESVVKGQLVKYRSYLLFCLVFVLFAVKTEETDLALVLFHDIEQGVDSSGLSCAVLTNKSHNTALRHIKADFVESKAIVPFGQFLNFNSIFIFIHFSSPP